MSARDRLIRGAAWDDFCEQLRQAGHVIDRFEGLTDLDHAEWYRFMTRIVRASATRFMENSEVDRPRLVPTPWRTEMIFTSPDQDHYLCEFPAGQPGYRITGNRGTAPAMTGHGGAPNMVLASWYNRIPADVADRDWAPRGIEGLSEFATNVPKTGHSLTDESIRFDEAGNFEILVTPDDPGGGHDWLPLDADSDGMLIRFLYHDRAGMTPPTLRIERLDGVEPTPVSPESIALALAKMGQHSLGYADAVRRWWQDNLAQRPNEIRFDEAAYLSHGGVAGRIHGYGTWDCGSDEALVIHFRPPPCDYWIFALFNIWEENLDNYEDGNGRVQKYTANYLDDGSIRVIVANSDPQIEGNWIDPYGHVHGCMGLRVVKAMDSLPKISVYRLPLARLRAEGIAALATAASIESGTIA